MAHELMVTQGDFINSCYYQMPKQNGTTFNYEKQDYGQTGRTLRQFRQTKNHQKYAQTRITFQRVLKHYLYQILSQLKLMNRIVRHFSIINKLKQGERLRQGNNFERCPTHLFNDQPTPKGTYETNKHLLSPYQQFLIETKSLERTFTGKFWAELSTGFYHCAVCDTRLFTFNHKFQSNTGHATFWRHVDNRIRTVEQTVNFEDVNDIRAKYRSGNSSHKRCECAQCSTHLGAVFFDGPPPTFLRFTINSALLNFYDMPDFPNPLPARKQKKIDRRSNVIRYIR